MKKISYSGYRFSREIIHQAIRLYLRFTLSFRDVEDLLAERGIAISYETVSGAILGGSASLFVLDFRWSAASALSGG
jgi:transposase-like protein